MKMNISEKLRKKLDRHQAYHAVKKQQLNELDIESREWINRYSRLLTHSNLMTKLLMEMSEASMLESFMGGRE